MKEREKKRKTKDDEVNGQGERGKRGTRCNKMLQSTSSLAYLAAARLTLDTEAESTTAMLTS